MAWTRFIGLGIVLFILLRPKHGRHAGLAGGPAVRPDGVDSRIWRRLMMRGVRAEQRADPTVTRVVATQRASARLLQDINAYGTHAALPPPRVRPQGVSAKVWDRLVQRGARVEADADPGITILEARRVASQRLRADLQAYGQVEAIQHVRPLPGLTQEAADRLLGRGALREHRRDRSLTLTEAREIARQNLLRDPTIYGPPEAIRPRTKPPEGVPYAEWRRLAYRGASVVQRERVAAGGEIPRKLALREAMNRLRQDPLAFGTPEPLPIPPTRGEHPTMQRAWWALSEGTRKNYRIYLTEMYGTAEPPLDRIRSTCPNVTGRTHEVVRNMRAALHAWLRYLGVDAKERAELRKRCISDVVKAGQKPWRRNPRPYGEGI